MKLAAAGHDPLGGVIVGKHNVYPEMAAAGLWTTPSDLARFFIAVNLALEGKPSPVPRSVATLMTTPVAKARWDAQSGLGVFVFDHRGATYFGHPGSNEGFEASATVRLGRGYGVVMMANSDGARPLFREMEQAIAHEYGWDGQEPPIVRFALADARLGSIEGTYAATTQSPFTLTRNGRRLEQRQPFHTPRELVPVTNDTLVRLEDGARFLVSADASAIVSTMSDGTITTYARVDSAKKSPVIELAAGHFDEALALYRALQQSDPKSHDVDEATLSALGFQSYQDGHLTDALTAFRANAALYPDSMNAHDNLGWAYAAAREKAKAVAEYEESIAAFARDTKRGASEKEALRKNAVRQLQRLRR